MWPQHHRLRRRLSAPLLALKTNSTDTASSRQSWLCSAPPTHACTLYGREVLEVLLAEGLVKRLQRSDLGCSLTDSGAGKPDSKGNVPFAALLGWRRRDVDTEGLLSTAADVSAAIRERGGAVPDAGGGRARAGPAEAAVSTMSQGRLVVRAGHGEWCGALGGEGAA